MIAGLRMRPAIFIGFIYFIGTFFIGCPFALNLFEFLLYSLRILSAFAANVFSRPFPF
jgi:hypothetical protein